MKTHLKLGTRKSLLAWAQSSWVARELIRLHSEKITVELVGIETQGDKILDKPLSQIEGKEFFTAELDRALLNGDVDFSVHSMKDLSLDRPSAITLAATPKREFSHDVAIFHRTTLARLQAGLPIRIGTSSPRRLTLVPDFLKFALPRISPNKEPILEFHEIRGNVNTRLSRIHEVEGTPKKLDCVILAFAGLERLAQDDLAKTELARLLNDTKLMVLPLRENPTAPAQGALAVEGNKNQPEVLKILSILHDPETLKRVTEERVILGEWGGGCHQKLGASWFAEHLYIKGQKPSGEHVSEIRGKTPATLPAEYLKVQTAEIFDFSSYTPASSHNEIFKRSGAVFIAHIRSFEYLPASLQQDLLAGTSTKRVWVSGTASWFKLAAKGVWVEGCTEGQGIKAMETYTTKKLLNILLPALSSTSWSFLSHSESLEMSPHFNFSIQVIPTYSHHFKAIPPALLQASHLYWSSGLAFTKVLENLPAQEKEKFLKKNHACGPGRTLMVLKNHGINPALFAAAN